MRIFALSDLHVDYASNMNWVLGLSKFTPACNSQLFSLFGTNMADEARTSPD